MKTTIIIIATAISVFSMCGCREYPENPYRPDAYFDFTIEPNSLLYQDLNIVSGWMYLTSDAYSTSRGLIVYRMSQDEFKAYDRLPPNNPYGCCDNDGNCTRLIVDSPFVVDNCNDIKYNILDGSIIEGDGVYPLIEYHTIYDGYTLRIYN